MVDVVKDGEMVEQNIGITDPLTREQNATCRWYLQQYVQQSPFSVDRAAEAEALLEEYPKQLLRQLPLRLAVLSSFEAWAYSSDVTTILIDVFQQPSDSEDGIEESIHQLFWETLEENRLWSHPNGHVIVRRCLKYRQTSSPPQLEKVNPWIHDDGSSTLNVLLVVARDLTSDPSVYEDVSPSIATKTLLGLRDELDRQGGRHKLNVEIVRPGTFEALKQHLLRTEEMRGPGYFHLVHFDTHGTVKSRKGEASKYGVLYFSDPNSDQTVLKPGVLIAKVLKRYRVPYAVLNSCESAAASAGDNANIAKLLLESGLRGVVGMSFKIASSSAAIFLRHFYRELLTRGKSFATSAAAGRQALRSYPTRPARFGLERFLNDSFVVVAYEAANVSSLFSPKVDTWRDDSPHSISWININATNLDEPLRVEQQLVGRDFDILRLEKRVLQSHVLYVSGLIGVGKTALLKYIATVWKSTNFVQATVHVDLGKQNTQSADDLLEDMLRQILTQVEETQLQMSLWSTASCSLRSYDAHMLLRILIDILSRVDAVIILENYKSGLLTLEMEISRTEDMPILLIIKELMSLAQTRARTAQLYFYLTERRRSPRFLEAKLGCDLSSFCFDLGGLGLPDALELSKIILRESGEPVEEWKSQDADCLESVVHLLQGIPSVLIDILPRQRSHSIPWRHFYKRLHQGLYKSITELEQDGLQNCAILREISWSALPPCYDLLLYLISIFWHQGPPAYEYVSIFQGISNDSAREEFQRGCGEGPDFWFKVFYGFIADRGYIRQSSFEYHLEIHPMFTIVGRAYLLDNYINLSNRVSLRTLVCASLEVLHFNSRRRDEEFVIEPLNLLTAVEFCLQDIPVDSWPLSLLYILPNFERQSSPQSLIAYLEESFFRLLKEIPYKMPLLEHKIGHLALYAFSLTSFCLNQESHRTSTIWKGVLEFSTKGHGLTLSLPPTDNTEAVSVCRGLLLTTTIFSAHQLGEFDRVQESAKDLLMLGEELHLPSLSSFKPADMNHALHAVGDSALVLNQKTGSTISSKNSKFLLMLVISTLQNDSELSRPEVSPAFDTRDREAVLQHQLDNLLKDVDLTPLVSCREDALELALSKPSDVPIAPSSETATENLNELERAYDTGEWLETCEGHLSLAKEALLKDHFKEAASHLVSMYTLANLNSASPPFLTTLQACQTRVFMTHLSYLFQVSIFPSKYFDRGTGYGYGFARKQDDFLHTTSIDEGFWGTQAFIWPSDGCPNQRTTISKWWEWWQWLLDAQGQNKSWVTHIRANLRLYFTQARLMEVIFICSGHNDFGGALRLLKELELACENSVFLHFSIQSSPLQSIRACFKLALEQYSIHCKLSTWKSVAQGLDDCRNLIFQMADLTTKPCAWFPQRAIEGFRYAADRRELLGYQISMREEARSTDLTSLKGTYQKLMSLIKGGSFSRLDSDDVLTVRVKGIELMLDLARNAQRWQEAISLCNEYLAIVQDTTEGSPRALNSWVMIKHECEWRIECETQEEAEDVSDFDKCLELLQQQEDGLAQIRENCQGNSQNLLVLPGSRLRSFQRQVYQDQCVECVDWLRQFRRSRQVVDFLSLKQIFRIRLLVARRLVMGKGWRTQPRKFSRSRMRVTGVGRIKRSLPRRLSSSARIRLTKQSLPHNICQYGHDRGQFGRPFGCTCRCSGGYCFNG